MFMFTMLDGRYSRLLQPLQDIREFYGILKKVPICTRLGSRGFIAMFAKIAWELAFQLLLQFLSQVSSAKPATLERFLALSNVCLVKEVTE
jgi:hypothetical protein